MPRISFAKPDWTSEASFSSVLSVREVSSGNLIVSDELDNQVHLLSAAGKSLTPIGRKGSGPAEYELTGRLIGLANDTTLLVDHYARRYLLIDGRGKIVDTQKFSDILGEGIAQIMGADLAGRLYFRRSVLDEPGTTEAASPIARWQRGSPRYDTVAMISIEHPKGQAYKLDGPVKADLVGHTRVRFAPVDDWAVTPSGRVAIIHATPYRVDWVEKNGRITTGVAVSYTPVKVTEVDKKLTEPKGPPFVRTYAREKSAFIPEGAVVDEMENLWLPRNELAGSATRRWDVFGATGKLLGTVSTASDRRLIAITRRYAYLVRTDNDGLRWIERYSR